MRDAAEQCHMLLGRCQKLEDVAEMRAAFEAEVLRQVEVEKQVRTSSQAPVCSTVMLSLPD